MARSTPRAIGTAHVCSRYFTHSYDNSTIRMTCGLCGPVRGRGAARSLGDTKEHLMIRLMTFGALGYGMWYLWNATATSDNMYGVGLLGAALLLELFGSKD